MSAVLVPKRILNVTLINHPVLDEAVAQEALERFRQAAEEVWGTGLAAAIDRLSPAAQRWRAEFVVRDVDTPEVREQALGAVLGQLASNLRRDPPSLEAGRALTHGQIIYSGLENGKICWGVTASLQGLAPVDLKIQAGAAQQPWPTPSVHLLTQLDTVRAAALSARPEATPDPEPRRRRLGR